MSDITIYHNPACGTSRNVLALIRNTGAEPTVVEYLKTPPDRATLERLIADLGLPVREVLREKGTPYDELGLGDPTWRDDQLIDFMLQHPILMNRPIVVTPIATRLCRPSETVLDILPAPQRGAFTKEDGEAVIDGKAGVLPIADPPNPDEGQFHPPDPQRLLSPARGNTRRERRCHGTDGRFAQDDLPGIALGQRPGEGVVGAPSRRREQHCEQTPALCAAAAALIAAQQARFALDPLARRCADRRRACVEQARRREGSQALAEVLNQR